MQNNAFPKRRTCNKFLLLQKMFVWFFTKIMTENKPLPNLHVELFHKPEKLLQTYSINTQENIHLSPHIPLRCCPWHLYSGSIHGGMESQEGQTTFRRNHQDLNRLCRIQGFTLSKIWRMNYDGSIYSFTISFWRKIFKSLDSHTRRFPVSSMKQYFKVKKWIFYIFHTICKAGSNLSDWKKISMLSRLMKHFPDITYTRKRFGEPPLFLSLECDEILSGH